MSTPSPQLSQNLEADGAPAAYVPTVHVPETPPGLQRDGRLTAHRTGDPAEGPSGRELTPLVVRDSFDTGTPPPNAAPPFDELPRTSSLFEGENTVGNDVYAAQAASQSTDPLLANVAEDEEMYAPSSPTVVGSRPGSPWGSSTTRVNSRSSSPLSFDWDSATEVGNVSLAGEPGPAAPFLPPHVLSEEEVTARIIAAEGPPPTISYPTNLLVDSSQASTDYWAYFTSPPGLEDPPHFAQHGLHGTPTYTNEASLFGGGAHGRNANDQRNSSQAGHAAQPSTSFGDQNTTRPPPNENINTKKRLWTGSPDPEDVLRSRRRRRQTTPASKRREEISTLGGLYTNNNPWRETVDSERAEDATLLDDCFNPVAVSTPAPTTINDQNGTFLTSHTPVAGPGPGPRARSANRVNTATHETRLADERGPRTGAVSMLIERAMEMDTDLEPMPTNANTAAHNGESMRRKGKGKGRALHGAQYPEEREERPDRTQRTSNEGWDERDILEARQRSLRQGMEQEPDWRGNILTGSRWTNTARELSVPRAGPSGTQGVRASRVNGAGTSERTLREDLTSHASLARHRTQHARSENDPYATDPETRMTMLRPEMEDSRRRRSPSEYVPAPNTRAAQYVTGRDHTAPNTTVYLPQRSPVSRIHGLQRSPSPAQSRRPSERTREYEQWDGLHESFNNHMNLDDEDDSEAHEGDDIAHEWRLEDGELLPEALSAENQSEDEEPTDVPEGGFPTVHRDDPETALRGMARDWTREIWRDAPGTDVLVDVFNYQYTEDAAFNRQIADTLTHQLERITGETGFDVVPPELEEGLNLRPRDLPTMWAIRGLTPRGTARTLQRSVWSFPSISFLVSPRAVTIPSWLFMVEGFLRGDDRKIRAAILRVLGEDEMRAWLERMASANPEFEGLTTEQAVLEVVRSLRIETLQQGNGNYVSNVYMRSPTRDVREWRRWVARLRSRRYRSFAIGTGRVRAPIACSGCRSVSHPSHLCPFPLIRGWNGPQPGQGVFGNRDSRENAGRPSETSRRSNGSTRAPRGTGSGYGHRGTGREDRTDSRTPGRGRRDDQNSWSWNGSYRGRGGGRGGKDSYTKKRY
ncbi:hypothetical protein OH76DRAFT_1416713 [Lentinus brumalis]|uniref:Uncharacterized protein n=1 Tax=Lentinus brumalis TaxID=2498619 RepID=A0A371DJC0_9APHY|nr:hypothetical protein OH76DRAFT_1416713 [Polyporus brumalis]